MKRNQSGFTLIEIAIVLVIIGLLLGGVMKGQELINSARVKNLAADFRNTSLYIYSYQDKYRAIPGDDAQAPAHVTGATLATTPANAQGNNSIQCPWDSNDPTCESFLFWQHVRLAGIATGSTNTADVTAYIPRNSSGGRIGITNAAEMVVNGAPPGTTLRGGYIICSEGIQGKFAKQLDISMDDGIGNTGSLMVVPGNASPQNAVANPDDSTLYTVCYGV